MTQKENVKLFKQLHYGDSPLVLTNIWDAGSAKAVAANGAQALATGSHSVAESHGYRDGENLPFPLVVANLERIVNAVDIPVSLDVETGYGKTGSEVYRTTKKVIEAGAVGINLEDGHLSGDGLYDINTQAERIIAARSAANDLRIDLFINARTDVYIKDLYPNDSNRAISEVLDRATAFEVAGASGIFIPSLLDMESIRTICEECHLPVNIMLRNDELSIQSLAEAGVSRISKGPGPYQRAMDSLII